MRIKELFQQFKKEKFIVFMKNRSVELTLAGFEAMDKFNLSLISNINLSVHMWS